LEQARSELLAEAEALPPDDRAMDDEALCARPAALRPVVQAWRQRELLAALQFAAVISGGNNDDPGWKAWTDGAANKQRIKRFKKRLGVTQDEKSDPLAFLVVKSMLLTGFDAPIEGVMYLDRPIREAELLQAIARVNRTGFGKQAGIVVDYFGVAHHLRDALAAYADQDIDGALASVKDAIPALRDRHGRVIELFRARRLDGLEDLDACVQVLEDERLRAEFTVKLKQFLASMDLVLPRPEALPYTADAKRLAHIYARARNRYKDTPVLGKDVGAKVRKLIDDHVVCLGIDPKVPPIQLGDGDFASHVAAQASDRAKASEMEHAIRHHIRKHLDEDPVLYQRLSERLHDLLARLGEKWDEVVAALRGLIDEMRAGDAGDRPQTSGLPERYVPFLRLLLKTGFGDAVPAATDLVTLHRFTVELVDLIAERANSSSFWEPHFLPAQEGLGSDLFRLIRRCGIAGLAENAAALKDQLLELARANQRRLLEL
jgi:type I restriction enzyme R subunit